MAGACNIRRAVLLSQDSYVASVLAAGEVRGRLQAGREAVHSLDLEHPSRTAAHRREVERRTPERYGASPAYYGITAAERGEWDRLRAMGLSPKAAAVIVRAGRKAENTGGAR